MKWQVSLRIMVRIIIFFSIAIALSFLPEQLREFFGDTKCLKNVYDWKGSFERQCTQCCGGVDVGWEWGARHYWFYNMMACLLILSVVDFIVSTITLLKKHYPKLF